jgi:peptide/nickel transport system ATP-binding protein
MKLLELRNLNVSFPTRSGIFEAVRGVSFSLGQERLGIVGESGSGKSLTGRAILKLIPAPGKIQAASMTLEGDNLLGMSERQMRSVRGQKISMVMQDPKFSLNPVMKVGEQMIEAYRQSSAGNRRTRKQDALAMLESVAIRDPERVFNAYPHEMSGGMGQRIMIAMMLIPNPQILIADEPTSALDVTVQMQVLNIMDKLVTERGMGLIFISHDLNLVSSFCDRVLIMYAGQIVESCRADQLYQAKHPYTQGLLESLPRLDAPRARLAVLDRDPAWKETLSIQHHD